jgi:NAD-dependent dihydropyrimidine dehydrogenase PreA subunit
MTNKNVRRIVYIDEEKCDGCGVCIPACAEGALQIINGKAKLIGDLYCDGLGACLGRCPHGAIEIREREAEKFDEVATTVHMKQVEQESKEREKPSSDLSSNTTGPAEKFSGCPALAESTHNKPIHSQWPIQLALVSPNAPFFNNADILLVADCVPFSYENFHKDYLKDNTLLVACPKLDDFQSHLNKLINIMKNSSVKSITVLHMDIPCCSGLMHMAEQALFKSGKDIPFSEVTITSK